MYQIYDLTKAVWFSEYANQIIHCLPSSQGFDQRLWKQAVSVCANESHASNCCAVFLSDVMITISVKY